MQKNSVHFSIAKSSQWAPGLETTKDWADWLQSHFTISNIERSTPNVSAMPAMLRRRARTLGKMALEVSYQCIADFDITNIPVLYCSRHGDVNLAVELITELQKENTISPIGFSSAVHNATAGLFSIAKKNHSNHIAIAAGASTVEHGVIEACGLIDEGAPAVLLVHYEQPLPSIFSQFEDCAEQAYAWAWLMTPPSENQFCLSWKSTEKSDIGNTDVISMPSGLQILSFQLSNQTNLHRQVGTQLWSWSQSDRSDQIA